MIKNFAVIALLGLAPLTYGQSTTPVSVKPTPVVTGQKAPVKAPEVPTAATPVEKTPELSNLEKLAFQALSSEFNTLQQEEKKASNDLSEFQKAVATNHPGYHFDSATGLAKDAPKVDKPAEKK